MTDMTTSPAMAANDNARPRRPELTAERLRDLLHYDPTTGAFTWRIDRNQHVKAGDVAGCPRPDGRWIIQINGRRHYRSRLAWLLTHGHWPHGEVDHDNLDKGDDRLVNLRDASRPQNMANRRAWGRSGAKGVYKRGDRFQAQICVNGRVVTLGTFPTAIEAHAAYVRAAVAAFGEFARAS
jgi:hypothetical protein